MTHFFNSQFVLKLLLLCLFHSFLSGVQSKSITNASTTATTTPLNSSTDDENCDYRVDAYCDYYDDELNVDESFSSNCSDIEFECQTNHLCIPIESYCDGRIDCSDESDELTCAKAPSIHFSTENYTTTACTPSENSSNVENFATIIMLIIILIVFIAFNRFNQSNLKKAINRLAFV